MQILLDDIEYQVFENLNCVGFSSEVTLLHLMQMVGVEVVHVENVKEPDCEYIEENTEEPAEDEEFSGLGEIVEIPKVV